MFWKVIAVVIVFLMISGGLFLVIYGVKGGLMEKKILADAWRKTYITGNDAAKRGWFYIILGVIILTIVTFAIIKTLKA